MGSWILEYSLFFATSFCFLDSLCASDLSLEDSKIPHMRSLSKSVLLSGVGERIDKKGHAPQISMICLTVSGACLSLAASRVGNTAVNFLNHFVFTT